MDPGDGRDADISTTAHAVREQRLGRLSACVLSWAGRRACERILAMGATFRATGATQTCRRPPTPCVSNGWVGYLPACCRGLAGRRACERILPTGATFWAV